MEPYKKSISSGIIYFCFLGWRFTLGFLSIFFHFETASPSVLSLSWSGYISLKKRSVASNGNLRDRRISEMIGSYFCVLAEVSERFTALDASNKVELGGLHE